ncbi:uncharacterized protein LOC132034831 [Lycium ferocissimum]|uniref:uncharacterized protein LOC132034831 n=1 Tax=Lycium ferocissimum TaxID=112874 RepID=UPI0028163F05|nr:uncharacterized protein LOC132034831 [Lycium ferocissimum]
MCMEAYLQGQDLWDPVAGAEAEIPANTPKNAESRRKWKIKCGKALFALRMSIGKKLIHHVRDVSLPKEVWVILERLFGKNNTARLQLLENELAMLSLGGMSISGYFLRVKSICAEISELDPEEKIGEARLRRFLIRGLKKEYNPFVTSIQGWAKQPSVEEFENLLSNQEALAKQMAKSFESDPVLFSKDKHKKKITSTGSKNNEKRSNSEKATGGNFENKKCYRCGIIGHIKKNCKVKLSNANVAKLRQHNRDRVVVTANNSVYPVAKEGVLKFYVGDRWTVMLNDYRAPGLKRNLVSVSQIIDSGKYILFGPNDVKVLDNVKNITVDVILACEKKGSLFFMAVGEAYVKKTSQIDSAIIWHPRLRHLGYHLLRQISSKKLVDDDVSRYTWVKFLKEKSEALSKLAEFKTIMEKEFGVKIKCLHSDNGGEYMSNDFFKYCDDNGIRDK